MYFQEEFFTVFVIGYTSGRPENVVLDVKGITVKVLIFPEES
jgi:hypothetical protein